MLKEIAVEPKFSTIFMSNSFPVPEELKALKKWCAVFEEKGLAPSHSAGTFGNLSFRLKGSNEFIITASSVGLKNELTDDDFVLVKDVDLEKRRIRAAGKREPSSESMLHSEIYRARKDVNAVFHGHCKKIILNSRKLGLTETNDEKQYGSVELVESVLDVLKDNNFIVMKGHGFLSLGSTMDEAGKTALDVFSRCF